MAKANGQMKEWLIDGVKITECSFDHDLHIFEIYKGNELVGTITPESIDDMKEIMDDLDKGISPYGWEDGMGNTISW
jgi:hypothetical protein